MRCVIKMLTDKFCKKCKRPYFQTKRIVCPSCGTKLRFYVKPMTDNKIKFQKVR